MRSLSFNGTRVCAKLAHLVATDQMRKEGGGGKNTIKIVVSEESGSCKFKGFSRKKDVLNNGTHLRDTTGPNWFGN